jgi:hypothetical protein
MTGKSSVSYHEKKLSAVLQKQSRQLLLWRHRALLAPPADLPSRTIWPCLPYGISQPLCRYQVSCISKSDKKNHDDKSDKY